MRDYYGMNGMGWYDFARSRGFTGTPEQLMDIMTGNIASMLDHRTLNNRDADDQHPITAIAGLTDALNRLEDEQMGGNAASDGWRTVQLYPIKWYSGEAVYIDATSEHWEYFSLPDEINLSEGVWEVELYVLGIGGNGIEESGPLLRVALIDRQLGVENSWQRAEPFAVSATQAGSAGSKKMQVRYRAIVQGSRYFCERDGYVQGVMTSDQSYSGSAYADETEIYANTAAVHIYARGVLLGTGGIYLRYRRMM